jgi:hypothetical protein
LIRRLARATDTFCDPLRQPPPGAGQDVCTMPKGILIAALNFARIAEDEFHDWYDREHLPERLAIPGFLSGERWIARSDSRVSVATYDLETRDVLASARYLAVAHDNASPWTKRVTARCERLLRYEGEQITPGDRVAPNGAGGLLLVAMNVAPEHDAEFNEWYNTEHIPGLAAVPGTLCARRYRAAGAGRRYVALYHFEKPGVADSAAWKTAANTPWTERMRPHFRDFLRLDCYRYSRSAQ